MINVQYPIFNELSITRFSNKSLIIVLLCKDYIWRLPRRSAVSQWLGGFSEDAIFGFLSYDEEGLSI